MKTIKTLALVAALGLAAPLLGTLPTAHAQGSRPNQVETQVPVDGVKIPYNGQTYTLSGSLHGSLVVQQQNKGYFIKGHLNAQGISVTGSDGTSYRGVGAVNFQARTEDDGATFKGVANIGLIGKGKDPNVRLKVRLRGSVDGSGQLTLSVLDAALSSK